MSKTKLQWKTVRRKLSDLIPYDGNPRTMTDQQTEALKKSIKRFNLVELPAVDLDGTVLAGNQRLRIMHLLGRVDETIEVRIPNRKLSNKEREQYLLTSNAVHGDWQYELLREFDTALLLDIGFAEHELEHLWDDHLEIEDGDFSVEHELARIKTTSIKPGNLFAIGRHRLGCIDSTDPKQVKQLLGKQKVDVINIDFPFNIGLSYNSGIGGTKNYGGSTNDSKSDVDYREFVSPIMANALAVAKPDCHTFMWCDESYVGMFQELYKEHGIKFRRLCTWVKDNQNPTPQVAFNKATEWCLYGTVGKPFLSDKVKNLNEVLNKEIGSGNRLIEDIIDIFNIWLVKRLPGTSYEHPTMKPPSLYEKALRRCSRPGDAVLDLCAGSGSVGIACEQLKRTAYLGEIEPLFCQLIINRFEQYGIKAKKIN